MSTTRTPDSAALKPSSIVHVGDAFNLSNRNVSRALVEGVYRFASAPVTTLLRPNSGGMIDR